MRARLYLSCMVICPCLGDGCMIKIMRKTEVSVSVSYLKDMFRNVGINERSSFNK